MNTPNPNAIAEFKDMIDAYTWEVEPTDSAEDTQSMLDMYEADRKDFNEVLRLYEIGEWATAYKRVGQMDTVARECVPLPIYNDLWISNKR